MFQNAKRRIFKPLHNFRKSRRRIINKKEFSNVQVLTYLINRQMKKIKYVYLAIYVFISITTLSGCAIVEFDTKRYFGTFFITLILAVLFIIIHLFSKNKKK